MRIRAQSTWKSVKRNRWYEVTERTVMPKVPMPVERVQTASMVTK